MKRTTKKTGTPSSDRLKKLAVHYGSIGGRMRMEALTDQERAMLASKAGRVGSKARAEKLSPERRREIARAAARARWTKD